MNSGAWPTVIVSAFSLPPRNCLPLYNISRRITWSYFVKHYKVSVVKCEIKEELCSRCFHTRLNFAFFKVCSLYKTCSECQVLIFHPLGFHTDTKVWGIWIQHLHSVETAGELRFHVGSQFPIKHNNHISEACTKFYLCLTTSWGCRGSVIVKL
jgi:hypothetical protein